MRVIAGNWKGNPLLAPPGRTTRPTGDRVKEAIFSMIGPYFQGGKCLDLFAGSGALGLEALSRGMEYSVFVDLRSIATVARNVERLRAEELCTLLPMNFETALKKLSGTYEFELVFLDPPYALGLLPKAMALLTRHSVLAVGATVVTEMDSSTTEPIVPGLNFVKCSDYGDTKVCIYRYAPEDVREG